MKSPGGCGPYPQHWIPVCLLSTVRMRVAHAWSLLDCGHLPDLHIRIGPDYPPPHFCLVESSLTPARRSLAQSENLEMVLDLLCEDGVSPRWFRQLGF